MFALVAVHKLKKDSFVIKKCDIKNKCTSGVAETCRGLFVLSDYVICGYFETSVCLGVGYFNKGTQALRRACYCMLLPRANICFCFAKCAKGSCLLHSMLLSSL